MNSENNGVVIRADEKFKEELDDIKVERIKNGTDRKLKSDKRLTLAIIRHEFWQDLKKAITEAPLKDKKSKRGQIGNIIIFIVIAFVMLVFFGIWGWVHGMLTDSLVGIEQTGGLVNISQTASATFGAMNDAMIPGLRILSFTILIGMIFSMLIVEFITRKNPVLFIMDFFILIIAFVLSIYVSNRYEALLSGQPFSSTLIGFKAGTYIMLHLPLWTTIIGVLMMIISFTGIIRRGGSRELVE